MRVRSAAAAAASVALLTVLARLAGFGRVLAFSQAVGDHCLATAYQTANQVPNVLFEVVAGGALAGVLVPLLSSRLASEDPAQRAAASRTASAALTWSLLATVVVAAAAGLLAHPLLRLLLARSGDGTGCGEDLVAVAATMLWTFLPQVPLYAVAVVLAGVLQAQQRFTAPAAAPLVSSLVVGGTYLLVGGMLPAAVARGPVGEVPPVAVAVLAGGTTLGVVALAATHLGALRGPVRWRPALRPAPGDGARVRSLAGAGLLVLLAQQVVAVAVTVVANQDAAAPGAVARWSYVWTLFLLPHAVLAVPVATAVFPRLVRAADDGSSAELADVLGRSLRTALLLASLGAAGLVAVAAPVAVVFVDGRAGSGRTDEVALALVLSAPGLFGYAALALLTRALYALGAGRAAAGGTVAGWGLTLLLVVLGPPLLPQAPVVPLVAAAHAAGFTLAGVLLLVSARRRSGGPLGGTARTLAAAVAAAAVAGAAGALVPVLLPSGGRAAAVGTGLLAGAVAALVWAAVARVLAAAEVRTLLGRARGVLPGRRG